MSISGLPSWIGSQAVAETGQRSMYNARAALGLAGAGWMSEMAGKTRTIIVNLTGSDHNFNTANLHQWMVNAAGGAWPANAVWRIIVGSGVQLVSYSTGSACMWFGGAINGKVVIENHGYILGRGGNGGQGYRGSTQGGAGGSAIYRESKITLEIINYGVIGGGGGGGGGANHSSVGDTIGAGGGAPFGAGGAGEYTGGGASFTNGGGAGAYKAGVGGGWGARGANAPGPGNELGAGGANGRAIDGGGSIIWTVQGDIRGGYV